MLKPTVLKSSCAFLALNLGLAYAASGVTIDKPKILYTLNAGQSVTGVVNVLNPGYASEDLEVKVEQNDWLLTAQGEARYLSPGSQPKSLTQWLSLPANTFALPGGGGQRDVRYTIQVPSGTQDGLYWGVLFFNSQDKNPAPEVKNATVNLNYKVSVGHVVYVQVGAAKREGRISTMKATLEGGKATVSTTLRNTGNTFLSIGGKVELRDQKGVKVAEASIAQGLVLPGYSRTFDLSFDKVLPAGQYLALAALEYQTGKFYTGETQFTVK